MRVLGFVLEGAALAGIVATLVTCIVFAIFWIARPALARLSPARRCDATYVLALLPGLTTLAVVAAVVLPSLLLVVTAGQDHCLDHADHAHLCIVHFDGVRPVLAVLGTATLVVFAARALSLLRRRARVARMLAALESMGRRVAPVAHRTSSSQQRFPIVRVPGPPRFCHAVGVGDRRILISESLARALRPELLSAAVLHEQQHLLRLDGLTRLTLQIVNLFALPALMRPLFSDVASSSEHACDAAVAAELGDSVVVADSLVEVSRVSAPQPLDFAVPALLGTSSSSSSIEQRVQALLAPSSLSPSRGLLLPAAGFAIVALIAAAFAEHAHIHHEVETLLALFH